MVRSLRFFLIVAVLAGCAAWLADQPGTVVMEWGRYEIETRFGVLAIITGVLIVLSALLYRGWLFLRRAPGAIRAVWRNRRQDRGYRALTRGMVAVAAGDGNEARRQARKAENLLKEPPLTMLLSAQAAQLDGDERAAERFFRAMTENPEMAFLGLRGLLNQATRRGDTDKALAITRRAHRLNPDSDWVSDSLFDLQIRAGQWLDAHVTVKEAVRNKHVDAATGKRRQAILTYQMSLEAARDGDRDRALAYARDALKLAPGFVPAAIGVATTLIGAGKPRKAVSLIEQAWARGPHPDMVPLYLLARGATEGLERVKAAEKLHRANADHMESDMAVAGEALAAHLWGKARDHLDRAASHTPAPPARVCRMMAELEESENRDADKARQWLVRATMADPDPAWVCRTCGHAVHDWSASCGNCRTFDGYRWTTPPHALRLTETVGDATPAPGDDSRNTGKGTVVTRDDPAVAGKAPTIKQPAPAEG